MFRKKTNMRFTSYSFAAGHFCGDGIAPITGVYMRHMQWSNLEEEKPEVSMPCHSSHRLRKFVKLFKRISDNWRARTGDGNCRFAAFI
jgi:hypothetical protein